MRTTRFRQCAAALAVVLALIGTGDGARADGLRIRILDREGLPVPEVAVYARLLDAGAAGAGDSKPSPAIVSGPRTLTRINQDGLAFDPHILIVETGTRIEFPNDDNVRHHVYSFSAAKRFDFSIDSGSIHEALEFDTPGIVTLGCNIHDDMLAYILVVDTDHFAMTNASGVAELHRVAAGRYELAIWTPRIAADNLPGPLDVTVPAVGSLEREFRFENKLYPPHGHSQTSLVRAY